MYEINYGTFNVGFENQIPYQHFFSINLSKNHELLLFIRTIVCRNPQPLTKRSIFFCERTFPVHVERLKYYLSDPLTRSDQKSFSLKVSFS